MNKLCEAICITHTATRKHGKVCNDAAVREFNGRPVCWVHHQALATGSRKVRFEGEPAPDFRAVAGAR